jgi:hypothetical protein
MLYKDAPRDDRVRLPGLHDAAKEAAVLLYSPVGDTFLEDLTRNADRVFYFDEGPRVTTKTYFEGLSKAQKSQTTQDGSYGPHQLQSRLGDED